jgi:hypothetical protein
VYRTGTAVLVNVLREGHPATTIQASVRYEGASLDITTNDGTGRWTALVVGAGTTIFGVCPVPGNDYGLAFDLPYVVATSSPDQPTTMVESARDLADVVRQYGQDPGQLLGPLVELSVDELFN